jgi:hypothetical protein
VIAHISGLPVEEVLPVLMTSMGAVWVAIGARARRRRPPPNERSR